MTRKEALDTAAQFFRLVIAGNMLAALIAIALWYFIVP
jgi:hypothetical protein